MQWIRAFFKAFDLRHVGECPTCMRFSFLFMVAAWITLAVATTIEGDSVVVAGGGVLLFSTLWLTHVATRAVRAAVPAKEPTSQVRSRRLALRTLAKAAVGAAALSAAMPWAAHADSGCGGWAGNSGCSRCGSCQRQTADCRCYSCRSCGNNCGNTAC
jgi:hypothetical protein